MLHRANNDLPAASAAAEQAVRCAPLDAGAWLSLSYTLSDETRVVRQDRDARSLSRREGAFLGTLYAQTDMSAQRATQLDGLFGPAWLELSEVGSKWGATSTTYGAFSNAMRLDPEKSRVYSWGLQMFQATWGSNLADLAGIAKAAEAEQYPTASETNMVADGMVDAGLKRDAQPLYARAEDMARKSIALDPNEAQPHYDLAVALNHRSQWKESVSEYQRAEQLRPTDAIVLFDLGKLLFKLGGSYPLSQQDLAATLKALPAGHVPVAITPAPSMPKVTAVHEFQAAVRIHPFPEAYGELCSALTLTPDGQIDAAIAAGKAGVRMLDTNRAHDVLANAYLHKHDYASCEQECRKSIALDPIDDYAVLVLGNALFGLGQKKQAQAQWRIVQQRGGYWKDEAGMQLAMHP